MKRPVLVGVLQVAVAEFFKSWHIFFTARPLVRLVEVDGEDDAKVTKVGKGAGAFHSAGQSKEG